MRASLFYLELFLKRIGIALLLFTICRLMFFVFNKASFPEASIADFIFGMRFDFSAIGWIYIPYSLFQLLPLPLRSRPLYRKFLKWCFHISNTICLVFNLIDVNFFSFTLKRTTADIISLIGTGSDFLTLLPQFILDYWPVLLIFFVLIYLSELLYRRSEPAKFPKKRNHLFQFSIFIIGIAFIAIACRGGFQLRPLNIISASQYTSAQNVPLVLNTPFTFIKSLFKSGLKEKHYFNSEELNHIFTPLNYINQSDSFTNRNVVVIILESYSKEYIGGYNGGNGFTPFLDSLMGHSLVFLNAFANGKRSIEALPAIFSGIPNLMTSPYITSPYGGNKISSIAQILKTKGYNTSFFHGGANGTMGFDAFTSAASFDEYYGREEYNNETDYDGNWGIFDEPFLQYYNRQLSEFPNPFFSSIFSLSSHHPYTIPDHLKNKFPKGDLNIHESIAYTDYALKRFFKEASNEPWFKNTVFLITADHTAQATSKYYNNSVGMYAIPLIVFDPLENNGTVNHHYTQQADIPSIVLHKLNYSGKLFAFGKDPLTTIDNGFCLNYNNGIYQLICEGHCLQYDGEESIGFFNLNNDSLLQFNLVVNKPQLMLKMERTIKAMIQSYNHRMINNRMFYDE